MPESVMLDEKAKIINFGEHSLARRIALAAVVDRPVKPWMQIVPGMFIVDFLRRTAEIRKYAAEYMFPRRLALDMARSGAPAPEQAGRAQTEIGAWLGGRGIVSENVRAAWVETVLLLAAHYRKLLDAGGGEYEDLIKNAYQSRAAYQEFIGRLAEKEREVDEALAGHAGGDRSGGRSISETRRHRETQRQKELEAFYY